jgi:hypothetical protein
MKDGEKTSGSGDKRSGCRYGKEGRASTCEVTHEGSTQGNSQGGGQGPLGREGREKRGVTLKFQGNQPIQRVGK